MTSGATQPRHVLGLSGGKDSAALAIFMRGKIPEMEYFFCDTGSELQETLDYIAKLETVLGKTVVRLNPTRPFEHWLDVYRGVLPSPQMRWCTKNLKLKPLEEWLGDAPAISYVAIRADENREGYVSTKPNIRTVFPLKEAGIDLDGVRRILEDSGVGFPDYYKWRTRSGCYFCFFQRKSEWVGLAEHHPALFEKAVEIEDKVGYESTMMHGRRYTWSQGETLRELIARRSEIVARREAGVARELKQRKNVTLYEVLGDVLDDEDDTLPCQVCNL